MVEGKVCTFCKQPIHWPQPYIQGQKPINTDGSIHDCPARQQPAPQAAPQQSPPVRVEKTSEKVEFKSADRITDMDLLLSVLRSIDQSLKEFVLLEREYFQAKMEGKM